MVRVSSHILWLVIIGGFTKFLWLLNLILLFSSMWLFTLLLISLSEYFFLLLLLLQRQFLVVLLDMYTIWMFFLDVSCSISQYLFSCVVCHLILFSAIIFSRSSSLCFVENHQFYVLLSLQLLTSCIWFAIPPTPPPP